MKKLKVKKGSTDMACLACVEACSEAFYKEFHPDNVLYPDRREEECTPDGLSTVWQMCRSLSGRCDHSECKRRLHDQQKEMYRLRSLCKSLSVWTDRQDRGQSGIQMYRMRYLCKSLSDGCTGSSRRVKSTQK